MDDKNFFDDLGKIVPIVVQVIGALSKGQQGTDKAGISFGGGVSTPIGGGQFGFSASDKGFFDDLGKIVPIVVQVIGALSKGQQGTDKASISFGGDVSTPVGGGQFGFSASDKGFFDDLGKIVPVVIQVIGALSKGQQGGVPSADKGFFDDLGKIVPVVIQVIGALSKGQQGGVPSADKGFFDDLVKIVPIVVQVIGAIAKGQQGPSGQKSILPNGWRGCTDPIWQPLAV